MVEDVRETLANIAADILSERRFTPFLRRLLAAERGAWQSVAELCHGLSSLPGNAPQLFTFSSEKFVVTHLAWPGLPSDDPGCMVLFFFEEEFWSYVTYLNTAAVKPS